MLGLQRQTDVRTAAADGPHHVRTAAADGPPLIRRVAVVAKAKLPCFARKYVVQNVSFSRFVLILKTTLYDRKVSRWTKGKKTKRRGAERGNESNKNNISCPYEA